MDRPSHSTRLKLLALLLFGLSPALARAEPAVSPPPDTTLPGRGDPLSKEKPRSGWAALPVGTYTPETELALGGFASHFFRLGGASAQTRPSSVSVVALYTTRNQLITELIPELYWDEQRSHLWSRLDYRYYPNELWAVGAAASDASRESYTEDRLRWQATFDRALQDALRFEWKVEIASMRVRDFSTGGLLAMESVPGARGGRTVGVGPGLLWDTRDHVLSPRRGDLFEVSLLAYEPLLGSQHRFAELLADLRAYRPALDGHTLALQLYAQLQVGSAPFYDLPQLGGEDLLRGYFEGRYRDEALLAAQVEYRLPLFWRLSGVAHAGVGQVAGDPLRLWSHQPKWSVGPGLRLTLNQDELLNLRADLGFSPKGYGLYVGVGEVF